MKSGRLLLCIVQFSFWDVPIATEYIFFCQLICFSRASSQVSDLNNPTKCLLLHVLSTDAVIIAVILN